MAKFFVCWLTCGMLLSGPFLALGAPPPAGESASVSPADGPPVFRTYLKDGSVVVGRLLVEQLTLSTSFGVLEVPLTDVVRLAPGLDRQPELEAELDRLIEQLGDADQEQAQAAQAALLAMGPRIIPVLQEHIDHSVRLRAALTLLIDQLTQRQDEDGVNERLPPWTRRDWIQTTAFRATGVISPARISIQTNYGLLQVDVEDIELVRSNQSADEEWRKALTVTGQDIAGRSWKNTGLRVERGDQVTVKADGTITYSPRGSQAVVTPDGAANYGWYIGNKIPVGALVGRIGNGGEAIMLGSRSSIVARSSGVLYLGWACQANYAQRNYNFPGQYQVKVTVTRPAE
ncbi:MAG: hypothetical protein WD042_06450 [Phycisphaeraceae bacterium]